jgi:tetratricopeptide (TPR) repeat protein
MSKPFVNRTAEMKHLRTALSYDGEEMGVLVFTGIGGMGKTALRRAFEKYFLKPMNVPYAVLDYDGDSNLRPIEATLRAIRRQLGRYKVRTPVFDFLYARYFEVSVGVKITSKNCPPELDDVATILDGIPGVGNVTQIIYGLGRLGLNMMERVEHKEWFFRIRDLEPQEILSILPEVLAEDLEEVMGGYKKTHKFPLNRITLLFDAYERLFESQIDDVLHRKILLHTPHLLRVVFSRDKLPWDRKHGKEWEGRIVHFPSLQDLSVEDSRLLMQKKRLEDKILQDYLYELTSGYPLHLELCADICGEIKETTGRNPGTNDFKGVVEKQNLTEELVNRLLRQLKDDERDLMKLAAIPRWINQEILEVLSSVPESVPRIFDKFTQLSMFASHPEVPDSYVIRDEVRNCLRAQKQQKRLLKNCHKSLTNYYSECWKESKNQLFLIEFLHHSFFVDSKEALGIFEEHFWKMIERFKFAEARSLLHAVPLEILKKDERRKIDFARARLLTSAPHTNQSLMEASGIYESLVSSETNDEVLASYLYWYAKLLRLLADYEKASQYLKRILDILTKKKDKDSEIADVYLTIGRLHWDQGKYKDALLYLNKSLEIYSRIYDHNDEKIGTVFSRIGLVLEEQGDYDKALQFHKKALTIRKSYYGENHALVAQSLNNIGRSYGSMARYDDALRCFEEALAIRLQIYGDQHQSVATSYNDIAIIYSILDKYEKALSYYNKSMAISMDIFGENHSQISSCYSNIGVLHLRHAKYNLAEEYLRKSINIDSAIYGENHPRIATNYNNLGVVYDLRKECEKALEFYQKALNIARKIHGEIHPEVSRSYNNIGIIFKNQGNYEEAMTYLKKDLSISLQIYGELHPDVATSYCNIGTVYYHQGEYEKALEFHKKSLSIRLDVFGNEHHYVAESYQEIALVLRKLENQKEAKEKMRKSISIYADSGMWNDAAECLEILADWFKEEGKEEEALKTHGEAKKMKDKALQKK